MSEKALNTCGYISFKQNTTPEGIIVKLDSAKRHQNQEFVTQRKSLRSTLASTCEIILNIPK